MSRLTLLLVEDDELQRLNIEQYLREDDTFERVVCAADGVEALDILRGEENSTRTLVLLDVDMPRMNGLEFLRELRADEQLRKLPVVVLTSSEDERDKAEAFELNVAGYIVKPPTLEDFQSCFRRLGDYWSMVEFPSCA